MQDNAEQSFNSARVDYLKESCTRQEMIPLFDDFFEKWGKLHAGVIRIADRAQDITRDGNDWDPQDVATLQA